MAAPDLPHGLIIDLPTPFRADGSIDGRGLGRILDRTMPFAQAFLLSGPSAGEGMSLSLEKRIDLLEKALVIIQGRIPLLVWITGRSAEETAGNHKELRGALPKRQYQGQVIWVDTPLLYHSNRGLPQHYRQLCSQMDAPLLLHNDPELISGLGRKLKRGNIRTAILKEICHFEGIRGLIFSGTLDRVSNYQRASKREKGFRIYDENEMRFLSYPSMHGLVSTGASIFPRAWQKVTDSSLNKSRAEKEYPDFMRQIWEVGLFLKRAAQIYSVDHVVLIKQVLYQTGVIESPLTTLSVSERPDEVKKLIELINRQEELFS